MGDPFALWIERWRLARDGAPILTFGSSLLPVRQDGVPAMLKIAHEPEEHFGAGLMVWWKGQGAAAVRAHEGEALLLERAMGARSLERLSHEDDDEACRILCAAIAAIHVPRPEPPPEAIPLERWFAPLLEGHMRYRGHTTVCAQAAAGLLSEPRDPVVLHGDIHHGNVLDFGEARGWLVIDPKRLSGERTFDYVNILRNGDVGSGNRAGEIFARRLDVISAAARLDRNRLLAWTLAFAGLSSVWRREEGEEASDDLFVIDLAAAELVKG